MSAPKPVDRNRIEDIAAHWVMRRDEAGWSEDDQVELDAWLEQSMAHKAAFWRLEHGWRQADRLGALGGAVGSTSRRFSTAWIDRSRRPLAIAASIAFLFLAVFAFTRWQSPTAPVHVAQQRIATAVGGHTRIPLADGSRIELNTATVLRAAVSVQSRDVWLDQGEAYFEVKHSDRVPFVVHAGPRTITVLGTKFSVRRDGERVTVSVVEGRVRVDETIIGAPPAAVPASSSTTVTTGDVAIADGNSTLIAARSPERIETGLAWREGMLSFDQTSLADVAKEFNRYNDRKLVITDPEVASIRIGGTFQASNVDAFARLLRVAYGLQVQSADGVVKISE